MAELMFPDIGGSFREGQAFGTRQRLVQQDEQRRSGLSRLASQAYGAPQEQRTSLLSQMAALDPAAAAQQEQQFASGDDRRLQKLGTAARYLESARLSGDPAKLQGAWNATRPMLAKEMPGAQFQEVWDDATMAPVLYQALAATSGSGTGNVQSTKIGEDGYYYTVNRAGQWTNSGIKANPNIKVLEQEGQVPIGVVTSGGVAGSTVNIGGSGQAQPQAAAPSIPAGTPQGPSVQMHSDMIASAADSMSKAGVPAQVIDAWVAQQTQGRADGPAPTWQNGLPPAAAGAPVRTPTAAETASAVQNAKNEADLKAYRDRVPLEVEAAGAIEGAKTQAKAAAESTAKLRSELPNLNVTRAALVDALKGFQEGKYSSGALTGMIPDRFQSADNQVLATTINDLILQTAERMKGTLSDKDVAFLRSATVSLDKDEAANMQIIQRKIAIIDDAIRRATTAAAPAPAAGGGIDDLLGKYGVR